MIVGKRVFGGIVFGIELLHERLIEKERIEEHFFYY